MNHQITYYEAELDLIYHKASISSTLPEANCGILDPQGLTLNPSQCLGNS